jgi:hypothetical protein
LRIAGFAAVGCRRLRRSCMGCAQLVRLLMLAATCWRCGKPKARCRRKKRLGRRSRRNCNAPTSGSTRLCTVQERAREHHAGRHASHALSEAEAEAGEALRQWMRTKADARMEDAKEPEDASLTRRRINQLAEHVELMCDVLRWRAWRLHRTQLPNCSWLRCGIGLRCGVCLTGLGQVRKPCSRLFAMHCSQAMLLCAVCCVR